MEKIRLNEWQLYNLSCALERLKLLDIKPALRYAVARNIQVVKPLVTATLEAFPDPMDPVQREAWVRTLEGREVEIAPYPIPFIPEFDDRVLAVALKAEQGESGISDEQIDLRRSVQNQAIMEALIPIIQESDA